MKIKVVLRLIITFLVDILFFTLLFFMVHHSQEKFDSQKLIDEAVNSSGFGAFQASEKKSIFRRILEFKVGKIFLVLGIVFLIIAGSGCLMAYRVNSTFDKVTGSKNSIVKSVIKMLPMGEHFFQILPVESESELSAVERTKSGDLERLNILLLGIRGIGDPNGGLLTDSIMVLSVKPETREAAMISVPRDLYVKIPYHDYKHKINEVYAVGFSEGKNKNLTERSQKGLEYSKKAVSKITGLDIHYAVSVDFKAFEEIIDTLGGVTITLNRSFTEMNQFKEGIISLPAGTQIIDGKTALLFVRARFSTSDFDRAKRQQQVLMSLKNKALSLGVMTDPLKIISILDSVGNHVRTDMELWEIQEMAAMAKRVDGSKVKKKVFDTSEEGLLYSSRDEKGSYILLPEGDNFSRIQEYCEGIFD